VVAIVCITTSILAWTYGIYPLVVCFLSKKIGTPLNKKIAFFPSLSIIIPTYNEESVIEQKIKNTLQVDYPKDRLEIILIDSKSTDETVEIAQKYSEITVIQEEKRWGKSHAINVALEHVSGDIVLLTDADCLISQDALKIAMSNFYDQSVGAVAAIPFSVSRKERSKMHVFISKCESSVDSIVSGVGRFLVFRRALVPRIDERCLADDFEISLTVRDSGKRVVFDPNVKVYESDSPSFKLWYQQIVRRTVTGLTTLSHHFNIVLNPSYGLFGLLFFPSRVFLPKLTPILIIVLLVSLGILDFQLLLFLTAIGMLVLGFWRPSRRYLAIQFAVLHALLLFFLGRYSPAWKKEPHGIDEVKSTQF